MMHHTSWCSSSHMVGHCNCGLFYHHHTQTNSFSMLFSMPNNQTYKSFDENDQMLHPFNSPPSVDCTLSLGTPSTRLTSDPDDHEMRSGGSRGRSNFSCWDFLQPKNSQSCQNNSTQKGSGRGSGNSGGGGSNNGLANSDPLLARRCANCDTTSTPLWRNGPRGPKSLCNACGIRYKKEERRATAANANATGSTMDHHYNYQNNSWVQPQKMTCFSPANNEFRFIEDNDYDTSNNVPFLSWRLNVTDRPSLVHDFTR